MPAKITRIRCFGSLGDLSFEAEVDVAEAGVSEAAKIGWDEVGRQLTEAVKLFPGRAASPPQLPAIAPQPEKPRQQQTAAVEFIDKGGTGEVFDVADDGRFKSAFAMLVKRREFTQPGAASLTQYLLSNARVHGFGSMPPPARLAVLEDIARGKYDSFKKGPQNGGGGQK